MEDKVRSLKKIVVGNIEHQNKLRECDEIKYNEKKCSPMSKTRSK